MRVSKPGAILKLGATVAATSMALAACGTSHHSTATPQGLQGKVIGVAKNSAVAQETRSAAASLTPSPGSFLAGKSTVTVLGSTTPANGDINPYAIWPVTSTRGVLAKGDILVDNFNNSSNNQGTGTTIVTVHPGGRVSMFASLPQKIRGCPGGVGLTTAMVQLRSGWVIVGSLPSTNGQFSTFGQGCLIELSPTGKVAGVIAGAEIQGPWDAAVSESGNLAQLFVSETTVGLRSTSSDKTPLDQGRVVRLTMTDRASSPPRVLHATTVASGFPERPDASAFVKGPTGLVVTKSGTLYVADNLGNRITAVPNAIRRSGSDGQGRLISAGGQLANPLGMALTPDGDLLVANATNGKIVEVTPDGHQVGEYYADNNIGQDPPGNGDLFDVAVNTAGTGALFVNDGTNVLELLH